MPNTKADLSEFAERQMRLEAELVEVRHQLDNLDEGREPMSDDEREGLFERLDECPDGQLVWMLLTAHKLVEQNTLGRTRNTAEMETVLLVKALQRFAPEAFADGWAIYSEHQGDDCDDEENIGGV